MVYDWYCVEEIHWIETGETNENDHFSVELSHIVELYEQETLSNHPSHHSHKSNHYLS